LDPFKEFILEQRHKGVTNASMMLRLLQKKGFTGEARPYAASPPRSEDLGPLL